MCARVGVRISISIDIPRPGSPVHRPRDRPHCPLDEHCAPAACLRASSSPLSSYPSLLRSLFPSSSLTLGLCLAFAFSPSLPPSLSPPALIRLCFCHFLFSNVARSRRCALRGDASLHVSEKRQRKGATGKEGTVTRGISGRANLVAKVAAPSFTRYTRSIRRRVR